MRTSEREKAGMVLGGPDGRQLRVNLDTDENYWIVEDEAGGCVSGGFYTRIAAQREAERLLGR